MKVTFHPSVRELGNVSCRASALWCVCALTCVGNGTTVVRDQMHSLERCTLAKNPPLLPSSASGSVAKKQSLRIRIIVLFSVEQRVSASTCMWVQRGRHSWCRRLPCGGLGILRVQPNQRRAQLIPFLTPFLFLWEECHSCGSLGVECQQLVSVGRRGDDVWLEVSDLLAAPGVCNAATVLFLALPLEIF